MQSESERGKVIAQYRVWLQGEIAKKNPEVLEALKALNEESVLMCWCAPLPCHSQVIIEEWEKMFG